MKKLAPAWEALEATREDLQAQAESTHELVSKIQETLGQAQDCCKAASEGTDRIVAAASAPQTVAKAEAALQLMREDEIEVPATLKFTSASCLRNGGVIYEVARADDALWLRRDEVQRAFLDSFGGQAIIRTRAYNVIAEYLPIAFDPASAAHLEDAEQFSG
ncbi:hypothetical protein A0H81_10501 [Grifola frondosa]|uniref:Uncharacterized protein n=1 Tax=Grifola frondosa TaxID=5627 RepID=A0A1C7M0Q8_GRIFR|nr:hypothetical protein A0H81_10501 [Grifola frondosa]